MPANPFSDLIWNQPPPPGRSGSLDRDVVVRAAVDLADESGAAAVTMAAVASRIGAYTPMALYRYVVNKDGLVDLMIDRVTGEIHLPQDPGADWKRDLQGVARSTWHVIATHPWYPRMFDARPPVGPNTMRRTELILASLTTVGLSTEQAMIYGSLLDSYVFGAGLRAAEEAAMRARYGLHDTESFLTAVTAMHPLAKAAGTYPLLADWLASPTSGSPTDQFELGLDCLLDGIAVQVKAAQHRMTRLAAGTGSVSRLPPG